MVERRSLTPRPSAPARQHPQIVTPAPPADLPPEQPVGARALISKIDRAYDASHKTIVAFILSSNRSGSSWLGYVLGAHDWASSIGEIRRLFQGGLKTVCRLCEAEGLSSCTMLDGIEHATAADCHRFAATRLGTPVIVDNSKTIDWCEGFVGRPDLDVRLIHLVRHPCGFVESEGRRRPTMTPAQLLELWTDKNREIERLVRRSARPAIQVNYDRLATAPDIEMPALCAFLGARYDPASLRYWTVPHHGLGANGAASLHLRGRAVRNFRTGDDAFYDGLATVPVGADRRWTTQLAPSVIAETVDSPYARRIAGRLGLGAWEH